MRKDVNTNSIRVCYLNIVSGDFSRSSRSGVHMEALALHGVEVVPCTDNSPGMRKFWEIFKKHRALAEEYDVIVVGYPAYILVPFARLISRKPIIFDAGWSLYEGTVVARGLYKRQPLQRLYYWCIDWIAYQSAHLVLLESNEQIAYYQKLLRVSDRMPRRLFTGVNEKEFFMNPSIEKRKEFTVLFRGYANPEAGLPQVMEAARILQSEGVRFLIISPNANLQDLPTNIELHKGFFAVDQLRHWMQSCQVSIGQVSTHERLGRTIPHKAYESMILGIPFLTADTPAVRELFANESAIFVEPGNVADIVAQIRSLKNDPDRSIEIVRNASRCYIEKCSNEVLALEIISHIRSVLD